MSVGDDTNALTFDHRATDSLAAQKEMTLSPRCCLSFRNSATINGYLSRDMEGPLSLRADFRTVKYPAALVIVQAVAARIRRGAWLL